MTQKRCKFSKWGLSWLGKFLVAGLVVAPVVAEAQPTPWRRPGVRLLPGIFPG